ncbi:MAG: glycosyltransferase family 4 protein [Syntrophobacteraceae bacterium]|jgi:glycosyltransferase involved in cell wall biosynthesis|nr:glycosyltransferase family 4 protein [Syntrophobacteraceae bacterium]
MLLNAGLLIREIDDMDAVLFIPGNGRMRDIASSMGMNHVLIPSYPWHVFNPLNDYQSYSRSLYVLRNSIINQVCDIVIINTLTSYVPIMVCVELGLPSVLWIHGIIDCGMIRDRNELLCSTYDRLVLNSASAVIYNSFWTSEFYNKQLNYRNGSIVYNWTMMQDDTKLSHGVYDNRIFVCLNTFNEIKGHSVLIDAVRILARKTREFRLELYGDGPDIDVVRQQVSTNHLEDIVQFKGYTDNVHEVYDQSLCLINPSYVEAFGMTLIEALSRKTPVIAARGGGPEEIVQDGINGYLFEAGNAEMLAGRMSEFLDNPQIARQMGERGCQLVREKFSPERARDAFTQIVRGTLAGFSGYDERVRLLVDMHLNLSCTDRPRVHGDFHDKADDRSIHRVVESTSPPVSCLRVRGSVVYEFIAAYPCWRGLDLMVGTYKQSVRGKMIVRVFSANGGQCREVSLNLATMTDNGWVAVHFLPISNSSQQVFRVLLLLELEDARSAVGVYEANPPERMMHRIQRLLGMRKAGNELYCRAYYG